MAEGHPMMEGAATGTTMDLLEEGEEDPWPEDHLQEDCWEECQMQNKENTPWK
jgi:hypothetical protein